MTVFPRREQPYLEEGDTYQSLKLSSETGGKLIIHLPQPGSLPVCIEGKLSLGQKALVDNMYFEVKLIDGANFFSKKWMKEFYAFSNEHLCVINYSHW